MLVFAFLCAFLFSQTEAQSGTIPTGSVGISLEYQINDDMICFTESYNGSYVWLGVAFGNLTEYDKVGGANWMYGADFYIGIYSETGFGVSDYYLIHPKIQQMPVEDVFQGCPDNAVVPPLVSSQIDNVTQIVFCRKLDTLDRGCDNTITPDSLNYVLFAHGMSQTFEYHGKDNRNFLGFVFGEDHESIGIDLPDIQPTYRAWHASFMVISFAILMPWGIFVARYLKSEQYWWWFPLHICMQLLACLLSGVAFVLITLEVKSNLQFDFVHANVGLTTLILTWLSPFLGLLSHLMYNPDRNGVPIFPDMTHWWVARLALLGGFVSIYLGIERLHSKFNEGSPDLLYTFSVLVVFYLTAFIGIELARRKTTEYQAIN